MRHKILYGEDVFDRIALFIYGIKETNYSAPPRKDGILKGIDLSLTNRKIPSNSDDDTKRIALFYNELSPYNLDSDGNLMFLNKSTHTHLKPFICKQYKFSDYLYYLRSNRENVYNRLVINPYRNCNSMCKWCARTYQNHKELYKQLKTNRKSFAYNIEVNAIRKIPDELISPIKLFEYLLKDALIAQSGDFSYLSELAVISRDFPNNVNISEYIYEFVNLMKTKGFNGTLYYAGHQIESKVDMLRIKDLGVDVKFVYTIEHFTKRLELMPVKGKRNLAEIADILLTATKTFGKNNIFYYYIAGIDDFVSIKDNFIRFKPFGKPLISVLTPYNNQQFGLYFSANKVGIIKQLCKIRELVLQMWGKPIPSGSNRSLFALNADIV